MSPAAGRGGGSAGQGSPRRHAQGAAALAGRRFPPLPALRRALPLPAAGHEAILVSGGEVPGRGGGAGARSVPRRGAAAGRGGGGGRWPSEGHLRAERAAGQRRAHLLRPAAPGQPPQEGRAGSGGAAAVSRQATPAPCEGMRASGHPGRRWGWYLRKGGREGGGEARWCGGMSTSWEVGKRLFEQRCSAAGKGECAGGGLDKERARSEKVTVTPSQGGLAG